MLELSNFLLPLCWASVPRGGFVPDSGVGSEVALATKHMFENEKRFLLQNLQEQCLGVSPSR